MFILFWFNGVSCLYRAVACKTNVLVSAWFEDDVVEAVF